MQEIIHDKSMFHGRNACFSTFKNKNNMTTCFLELKFSRAEIIDKCQNKNSSVKSAISEVSANLKD